MVEKSNREMILNKLLTYFSGKYCCSQDEEIINET